MMITRRRLLTSSALLAGGALLTSPFTSRRGHAADSYPRRVVIFIEGNGIRPECVMDPLTRQTLESIAGKPIASNRDYGHADPVITAKAPLDQARSLGALAAQGQELSLVERSALVLGLSATQVGGGHSSNFGALSASKALGGAPSATIDAVLAAIPEVRAMTPFDAIRVGAATASTPFNYSSCAFAKGKPAPILLPPSAAFSTYFGVVASGAAAESYQTRKRYLEYALEDVGRELKAFSGSSKGHTKLSGYHESITQMLDRHEQLVAMKGALLAVKPTEPGELDPDPYLTVDPLEALVLQAEIATAALLAGLTNVAVISIGSGDGYWGNEYPSLEALYPGQTVIGGHDLRHSGNPDALNVLHEVTSIGVGQLARMARALADRPEPGGTMLDNTLLVYISDNGEKHHSNAEEWATLLVGGDNLGFKTDGRSVAYPRSGQANNRQTSNLFNTILHSVGAPTDDFGHLGAEQTRVAKGPLAELWG
jgi:hypothetical protein